MEIISVNSYEEMSEKTCSMVLNKIKHLQNPVLGLATGSTPEGLYHRIIDEADDVSFRHVSTFNLDEYVGLNKEDPNSYQYYMNDKLFKHIDIPDENAHLPNGVAVDLEKECHDYERFIREAGHVDIQILGLGLNGHIGFNEPGTSFSSRTHVVDLDESTRNANARFFGSIDEVPTKAITMGIETIMESKEILLLVSGEAKAEALARLVNGEVTESFPASILQQHEHVTIIADEAALSKL
ncbi:glucosamine-6-phosphate deaminase [Virgibacillus natechei]|uniref:Glucosamine-6-phosphate deaminase n=1 Tax=Virgibacillus natechei TaxID=1216297 RepID=A0ABS4ILL0_9BACI|nr:glucosamine-6-phosphate deaminase [Virgibacillus natechei]MBP1971181.1 glucosamine-6-phosphate deaminase [Virgibacillus natechei]UZD11928.1 glucosamine-6-phosphate deaminase [Virgibacillus natechei]